MRADPFINGPAQQPGPEFYAGYDGECAAAVCLGDGLVYEGDLIRAIGDGDYAHSDCIEAED
jgi:hypothetical protein